MYTGSFQINGALPITLNDFASLERSIGTQLREIVREEVTTMVPTSGMTGTGDTYNSRDERQLNQDQEHWWRTWNWNDGKVMHFVPQGWSFPNRVHIHTMWDLWHYGHMANGIRPYKLISRMHDLTLDKEKKLYSTAKVVMDELTIIIIQSDGPDDPPLLAGGVEAMRNLDRRASDEIMPKAIRLFIAKVYGERKCNRVADLTFSTLYNRFLAWRKNEST
jgi:hypothetical protein